VRRPDHLPGIARAAIAARRLGRRVSPVPAPTAQVDGLVAANSRTHLTEYCYEVGPRAGLSVKEVLQRLLREASFAILVHTAEDEQGDGGFRARENVVHETGLFQGKLGFERVTVLREEGCESFSNQSGINEIRFSQGNIRETYGEVVSTLFREFPVQQ